MTRTIRAALVAVAMTASLASLNVGAVAQMSHGTPVHKRVLTLEMAKRVGAAAAEHARSVNAGGAIAIVDDGGYLLYLERLDNTFPAAASVATGKARTAATFRRDTKRFEDAIANGRVSLVGVTEMVPLEGGVPIVVDGQVVGAIGVSGAMSADQDEEIAQAAVKALS